MNRKKLLYFSILILIPISLLLITLIHIYFDSLESSQVVDQSTMNHASNLLFIRKDCHECEELLLKEKSNLKKMLIIDLSIKENRKYIEQYGIISVPTLFVNQHEYMGVDDIQCYLKNK